MLQAEALGCWRDRREIFSKITFNLEPSSVIMVSGSNGSGKSTLLKILAGLQQATSGTLTWQGKPLKPLDPHYLKQLLYIGHKISIQPALTPLQNLHWLLAITPAMPHSNDALIEALHLMGLQGFEHTACERLSKGQCQRVALARLMLTSAQYWIVDEPFTALDDSGVAILKDCFLDHLDRGGRLILASHHPFETKAFQQTHVRLKNIC